VGAVLVQPGKEKAPGRPHCSLPVLEGRLLTGGSLFTRSDSDRRRRNGFKLREGKFKLDDRRKSFPQRAVRRWHSCPEKLWGPIPGGTQGQEGWGSGQPELVGGNPAGDRGIGTRESLRSPPT